jgi:hypothetical protein
MTPRVQNAVALVSLLTAAAAALSACVASCPAMRYLDESSPSNGKPLHVVVDYGTHATGDVFQLPTNPDHPGTLGGCGGPWHYEPVVISAP